MTLDGEESLKMNGGDRRKSIKHSCHPNTLPGRDDFPVLCLFSVSLARSVPLLGGLRGTKLWPPVGFHVYIFPCHSRAFPYKSPPLGAEKKSGVPLNPCLVEASPNAFEKHEYKTRHVIAHATHLTYSASHWKIGDFLQSQIRKNAYVPPVARFRTRGGFSVAFPRRRRG